MGSSWVNVKSERQAWRLELQAGADPAVLRQNFFFLQEASGFALRAFDWLDEATTVLSVIYWSSDDGCEPHPQNTFMATSRWVFGWIIGQWLAQADRQLTITVPVKCFFLGKIPTFALLLLHSAVHLCFLWDMLSVGSKISEAYRYCGHVENFQGKKNIF